MASSSKPQPKIITLEANAAISRGRILKFNGEKVEHGAAAGDSLMFVSEDAAAAADDRVECIYDGGALVEAAGTIAAGAAITSNASGQAVTAAAGNRIIGYAMQGAVSGDLFPMLISQGLHT